MSIGHAGTHRRASECRTRFERLPRTRVWIGGISICLLAASAIVAVVHTIPASYASIPDEIGSAPRDSENAYADGPQPPLAVARDAVNRRDRASCPECGFVESIRAVGSSGNVGVARDISGNAIAGGVATAREYEITIRTRDGSTTVFTEATPREWRSGSRVIVIGGSKASND